MSVKDWFVEFYYGMIAPNENEGRTRFSRSQRYISIFAILPQILGFIVGCAFARLFGLDSDGYIYLGIVFAFIIGTLKSNSIDKYPLLQSMRMNCIMTASLTILLTISLMISDFKD